VSGKRVERSLVMGLGLFEGMTQLQLRSVLAHEHGHFRNADTAGGGFALAVRRSLHAMILGLARSGAAGNYNPAWWFMRSYYRVYLGVSQGASRLQEVLADRSAIAAYGSAAFVAGYRHVVSRGVRFDQVAGASINEVLRTRGALPNLYRFQPANPPPDNAVTALIEKAMTREPTAYDSHPSSRQRIAWAEALAVSHEPRPDDDEPIWALFTDREQLERRMTATVRDRIYAQKSIAIPAEAVAAPAAPSTPASEPSEPPSDATA
jgi:Zn-dependent protease with chaperone function